MLDGVGGYLTLAQVNALVTGDAPANLNTLSEIADAFGDDPEFLTKVNGALAKRLRFDAAQTLTIPERQQAQANLGLLVLVPDFVQGLRTTNNSSDANNRIDIDPGIARRGALSVVNEAVMTKRLDAVWAVGTGNGGLDTGAKTPGATYHLHAIVNNTTGVFDALFSLSATAPTLPNGWSRVQRFDAVLVDGSGNIRQTRKRGDWTILKSPVDDYTGGQRAMSPMTITVPNGVPVRSKHRVRINIRSATDTVVDCKLADGDDNSAITAWLNVTGASIPANDFWAEGSTNISRQINASFVLSLGSQSGNHLITTLGWDDYTIPRIG
ncbi:hypothetical protein IB237_23235 [Agrobacterium sp. AGB01]|nr:hypothetical protein [Agrobacterium sp. AGB01]